VTTIPSWLAALGIFVPALTGLVGYWLAGLNEEARDRRAAIREAKARREALAERLDEKKHTLQLELLLELQVVLQRQVRASFKVVNQDLRTLHQHGQLGRLPEDIDQDSFNTGVEFGRLRVRVLNDDLRSDLEGFHKFTSEMDTLFVALQDLSVEEKIAGLERAQRDLASRYISVNESLGVLVRAELGRELTDHPQSGG
jgi:hypothetical protein